MAYETKELAFSAFKNNRKEKDTQADFTGEMKINGKLYWFNMWQKTDRNGNPYFSGSVREKAAAYAQAKATVEAQAPLTQRDDIEDSIPF